MTEVLNVIRSQAQVFVPYDLLDLLLEKYVQRSMLNPTSQSVVPKLCVHPLAHPSEV